jgi:hypothetical protein
LGRLKGSNILQKYLKKGNLLLFLLGLTLAGLRFPLLPENLAAAWWRKPRAVALLRQMLLTQPRLSMAVTPSLCA